MIEALTALVFKIKDRRRSEEPVAEERRSATRRQAQQNLSESIDRLHDAVERKLK